MRLLPKVSPLGEDIQFIDPITCGNNHKLAFLAQIEKIQIFIVMHLRE